MPIYDGIKRVLVIGSGPIIIGQAAEFDYSGTQACKALKEEGLEVVLVNSNPATIMTDKETADAIYIEPINAQTIEKIIEREKPDGLLPTLGGQTGLNMAVELSEKGVLDKYDIRLLGTSLATIKKAEDRELFKKTMLEIDEPIPESKTIHSIEEAIEFVDEIGYPAVVRPAYTLGGTGGGIAGNEEELRVILKRGLKMSRIGQALIERSVAGWKEIEYEVIRDSKDNCIIICNMENLDPIGIHTGDSIVVAPSQTLVDKEYQMLRSAALKIIRALGVEGGCNIQYALDPESFQYYVIEVNPRVSRSSALASKATGYPIAKIAAKIAVGLTLDEMKNPVTGSTSACYEPALDYVVTKIPRWPFDKFELGDRVLGTQMKATGEVMAIDRCFEGSLMKAFRSLEIGVEALKLPGSGSWTEIKLENKLRIADDERIFAVAESFRRGWGVHELHELTKIDKWFLEKIKGIIDSEKEIIEAGKNIDESTLEKAKHMNFPDSYIAKLTGLEENDIKKMRKRNDIKAIYKTVDTCAAEFESVTPYYYSSFESGEDESAKASGESVVVIGSGPIRIGQGIEFDYCSVHSVKGIQQAGLKAIIINNNPETVSTDFDTSDKLYFEPLTLEDVMNVVEKEKPRGVIVQFGGQTAINLADGLCKNGVNILGTSFESIDIAEDRKRFDGLLTSIGVPHTEGDTAFDISTAVSIAQKLGYPVLVRPSYVLGGRAMEVVYNTEQLIKYMESAVKISSKHPVLIDKYINGKEVEVDAIGDGEDFFIPGIMEHVERAGVHSGDSIAVYPPYSLDQREIEKIVEYTVKIGRALNIKGLFNIQYVVSEDGVFVLEVNPRASRTVPILSKVTGVQMVQAATRAMLGESLAVQDYYTGLKEPPNYVVVKAPVFSFEKLGLVEVSLSPEMKSTGEVMGIAPNFEEAFYKAILASGFHIKENGTVMFSISDRFKEEAVPIANEYKKLGFKLAATEKTAAFFNNTGVDIKPVEDAVGFIRDGKVNLVINVPTVGKVPSRKGFKIRRAAVEYKVPCFTSLDTAKALARALNKFSGLDMPKPFKL